jgi:tetrahydromethanopterin S-methyltransferase subunit B
VDEAYAALRDLKCEVKRLVVDPATGQATSAVEEFGTVQRSFNPVFESSNELEQNIEDAITAPNESYRF